GDDAVRLLVFGNLGESFPQIVKTRGNRGAEDHDRGAVKQHFQDVARPGAVHSLELRGRAEPAKLQSGHLRSWKFGLEFGSRVPTVAAWNPTSGGSGRRKASGSGAHDIMPANGRSRPP